MERRRRIRVLITRLGIVAAVGVSAMIATALPAWAHHPLLSGDTRCSGGSHLVVWTIGNSEGGTNKDMTIQSANAVLNGTSYAVQGYRSPVVPGGKTFAITVVPAGVFGNIKLTVTGRWPDGSTGTRDVTVTITDNCTPTTTIPPTTTPPTTEPPTTIPPTTAPPTTEPPTTEPPTTEPPTTEPPTTEPPVTVTTAGGDDGGTTTTTDGPPVTVGGSTAPPTTGNPPVTPLGEPESPRPTGTLPFTGGGIAWGFVGVSMFIAGLAMVLLPQRKAPTR